MQRLEFLRLTASASGVLAAARMIGSAKAAAANEDAQEYLRSIRPSSERIVQFTDVLSPEESMRRSNGWTYDPELGWVHCAAVHSNGVDRSKTFYHYEPDGARKISQFGDRPCRIHAYGDSFTHCDQVSDGETWEEFLAAHLQEPVRNFGVGGFSVYQAFRRMLQVEKSQSAEYIILNIYDDDHFRNLDAWRSIRAGAGSQCGFTLPHLRVNVADDRCEPVENLLSTREGVVRLRDTDFIEQVFANDPILKMVLATRTPGSITAKTVDAIAASFGISAKRFTEGPFPQQIRRIHTEAALFATTKIVGWTEDFARRTGKKLMLMLSFGPGNMTRALAGEPGFDQTFVDWLRGKPYPVIDMREAFGRDYRSFNGDIAAYLKRYYNGHHTPAGNFFTAWSIKDRVAERLDPPPLPYRP
ncbi:MAG: hypothetical protein O2960_10785 [Verrucomicrobia bacterium]|nr:hypothetical protein [Verrucomicrobiota bacterium]